MRKHSKKALILLATLGSSAFNLNASASEKTENTPTGKVVNSQNVQKKGLGVGPVIGISTATMLAGGLVGTFGISKLLNKKDDKKPDESEEIKKLKKENKQLTDDNEQLQKEKDELNDAYEKLENENYELKKNIGNPELNWETLNKIDKSDLFDKLHARTNDPLDKDEEIDPFKIDKSYLSYYSQAKTYYNAILQETYEHDIEMPKETTENVAHILTIARPFKEDFEQLTNTLWDPNNGEDNVVKIKLDINDKEKNISTRSVWAKKEKGTETKKTYKIQIDDPVYHGNKIVVYYDIQED